MNPWFILGLVLAWGATVSGAFFYGEGVGEARCEAATAREEKVAQVATDAANKAAGEAIAKIEVKHTTVRQKLETEVREKTVYRDCRSGPNAVSVFNSTIPGGTAADTAGAGKLPAPDAAGR